MTATWRELDELDVGCCIDVDALVYQAKQNVVELEPQLASTGHVGYENQRRGRSWRHWVAAGAIILLVGVSYFARLWSLEPEYQTELGQQLTFTLNDGTVVLLNTQSALDSQITENKREVTLLEGEVMFEVAKDPTRPFRVRSGTVIAEAIGTRFNVYQHGNGITVTVEEGSVSVSRIDDTLKSNTITSDLEIPPRPLILNAGEEAKAQHHGEVVRVENPDFEKSIAWRDRRLVFRSNSLESIAAEFNRYNRRRIDVQTPSHDSRKITGTFDADDLESFIVFLEKDTSLNVSRYKDRVLVRPSNVSEL